MIYNLTKPYQVQGKRLQSVVRFHFCNLTKPCQVLVFRLTKTTFEAFFTFFTIEFLFNVSVPTAV